MELNSLGDVSMRSARRMGLWMGWGGVEWRRTQRRFGRCVFFFLSRVGWMGRVE